MDKSTFVALCTEEGITRAQAETIWDDVAAGLGDPSCLFDDPERIRWAARITRITCVTRIN